MLRKLTLVSISSHKAKAGSCCNPKINHWFKWWAADSSTTVDGNWEGNYNGHDIIGVSSVKRITAPFMIL